MKNIFFLLCLSAFSVQGQDWPNLQRFRDVNEKLGAPARAEKRIVMMGNSITEGWLKADPDFFEKYHLINRGISGQTTPQMLIRFRQDVIDLEPAAVFILAGINDIAGNTGPSTLKMIEDNIASMSTLARAAGIKVVLCSVLPANRIGWRDNMNPAQQISELNAWIKKYAKANGFIYMNYFDLLVDAEQGLPQKYSGDGVHPNGDGYKIMEQAIIPLIGKLRKE